MAIVRCSKGIHYYDNKKYMQCPQCGLELGVDDEGITVRLSDEKMHPMENKDDQRTIHYAVKGMDEEDNDIRNDYITGWIVCESGPAKGRDYRIFHGNNLIGRESVMDICIEEDAKITRHKHCSIVYDEKNNCFYLVPGAGITYFKDSLLENAVPIVNGEHFGIGDCSFVFIAYCTEERKW